MASKSHGRARGYTLVELLAVLAVLGLLAALVMPLAEMEVQRQREAELKRALWELRDAIDAYKKASDAGAFAPAPGESGYPPNLQALVAGTADVRVPGRRLVFLRRIPRDPFADPALPAEQTWALRSYASPPQQPAPGADVYDVASRSTRKGLNGQPLREW